MEIIIYSSQFWSFIFVLFSFQGCGVANLVDKYLGHLYPDYFDHTRTVLIRQARDILVCTYHGNLARFEERFMQPTADIVSRLKDLCQHGSVSTWLKYFFIFFIIYGTLYEIKVKWNWVWGKSITLWWKFSMIYSLWSPINDKIFD